MLRPFPRWRPSGCACAASARAISTAMPSFAPARRSLKFVGGTSDRRGTWGRIAAYLGHWVLRGYGHWAIEEKASGRFVGYSGLWNPEGWPEPEVIWGLARRCARQGLRHGGGAACPRVRLSRARLDARAASFIASGERALAARGAAPRRRTRVRIHALHQHRRPLSPSGPRQPAILIETRRQAMSVKIRLSRGGTKKRPYYYIVVAEADLAARRALHRADRHAQSAAAQGQRRPRQARRRAGQALAQRRRAADRPRDALPRRGGPRQARSASKTPTRPSRRRSASSARRRPPKPPQEGRGRRGQAGGVSVPWLARQSPRAFCSAASPARTASAARW